MFVVVVPFAIAGAIATTLAGRAIKEKAPAGERIDYAGAALITLGLGGVVGALILGPAQGFVALYPAALGITGIVLLTVFVVVEYRTRHRFYHSMLSPRGNSPASMQ